MYSAFTKTFGEHALNAVAFPAPLGADRACASLAKGFGFGLISLPMKKREFEGRSVSIYGHLPARQGSGRPGK